MSKVLFVLGTRPEAIKLAPLIRQARKSVCFETCVCSTGQHQEMLQQVLEFFHLTPDYNLDLMSRDQKLHEFASSAMRALGAVMEQIKPSLVIVQGDTTTTMIGALTAFYNKIKVAHVEAGLRSNVKFSPYPEEVNRIMATHLADYHFAPTSQAAANLRKEGVFLENIHVVGNTVVDALLMGLQQVNSMQAEDLDPAFKLMDFSKHIILVTGHRRESFGKPLENICNALSEIAEDHRVEIVYPVHLNPRVREPVFSILGGRKNIHLIEPVDYPSMIYLMNRSHIILTDSGGVQEEAPSLCKPVLVLRDVTERTEGIEEGVTRLVGTSKESIVHETFALLNDHEYYSRMATGVNPYGDGLASRRILEVLERDLEADGHTVQQLSAVTP
jgi:UDP-N-acetylglucosamine 2-epimerase (non-hydrolysing)